MSAARGTSNYNCQLDEEKVRKARIWVMKGPVGTLPQVARRWGVGTQTLRNAVIGKNWKWLPPPTPAELAATPLPDWIELGRAPARTHCGQCIHWDAARSCTLGVPESGGFFATSCACFWEDKG